MENLTPIGLCMYGLLFTMLVYSAYTDYKHQIIKNIVTIPSCLLGFLLNYLETGTAGLMASLFGCFLLFLLFLVPYLFKQMGAGDVKLVMAIGALMGAHRAAGIIITGSFLAAVYAVGLWLKTKNRKIEFPYGLFLCLGAFVYEGLLFLYF